MVFLTKYRRREPNAKILARYKEIMIDVCCDFGACFFEFNGETGPRHLLVEYPPVMRISPLV